MTNLDALSSALDAMFAEPLSPEGGGGFAASAPRAAIAGGRKWARLLKWALTDNPGEVGLFAFRIMNPSTLHVVNRSPYPQVECRWGNVDAWVRYGEHTLHKDGLLPLDIVSAAAVALFSPTGYTLGDKTLRATSPTDITLALEGDTVVATFQPPLKVSKSILSFNVSRLNVFETRVHVVVDGFLGKDQWIELE